MSENSEKAKKRKSEKAKKRKSEKAKKRKSEKKIVEYLQRQKHKYVKDTA